MNIQMFFYVLAVNSSNINNNLFLWCCDLCFIVSHCYSINIDFLLSVVSVYGELYGTGLFEEMSISTDEDEHSIEMHLPYIAKVMERYVTSTASS